MRSVGAAVSLFVFFLTAVLSDSNVGNDETTLKVLVTGFEPFLDYDENPSGDVAKAISGTCVDYALSRRKLLTTLQICFDGIVLPVNTTGASVVADMLNSGEPFPYDAVLHLGLEDIAKGLKLETFAINQLAEYDSEVPQVNYCFNNSDLDQPTGTILSNLASRS
jgi:hypothetical protein